MQQCRMALNLSSSAPAMISGGLAAFSLLVVLIAYISNEKKLRKTYYGVMDGMDEEEKKQLDAEAMGTYVGEVKIVQSMETVSPALHVKVAKTPASQGFKVMVKRRRAASVKPSGERLTTPTVSAVSKSPVPVVFKFTLFLDRRGVAPQLLEVLEPLTLNEVIRYRSQHVKEKDLPLAEEMRIAELAISETRNKLEELSKNAPWIIHGRLMNNPNWIISGHESLLENPSDLILNLKMFVDQPLAVFIFGFEMVSIVPTVVPSAETARKNKSLQVASTPLTTLDALTPLKKSTTSLVSNSGLKRVKTAEAIHQQPSQHHAPPAVSQPSPQQLPTQPQVQVQQTQQQTQPSTPQTPVQTEKAVKTTESKKPLMTPKARTPRRSPPPATPVPAVKPSPKPNSGRTTAPPAPAPATLTVSHTQLKSRTPVTSVPRQHKKKLMKRHSGEVVSSDDTQQSDVPFRSKRAM